MRPGALNILIVTPAPRWSRKGNRITALRWAVRLRQLGHFVRVREDYESGPWDLLVALHARKSHPAMSRFRTHHPNQPIVLGLTGTDLYDDIHHSAEARQSLEWAKTLVVLQAKAIEALPPEHRPKGRVIYQSVQPLHFPVARKSDCFEVCVVGHLREVKDPLLTAKAVRLLPAESRIKVAHYGGALEPEWADAARREESQNPRYHWYGELSRRETLRRIAESHLLSLTSRLEGGANVVGEAIVCGTPVISTCIDGSIGILGDDYPGYFPVGDVQALAQMLWRAETDKSFYRTLLAQCQAKKPLFTPDRERDAWRSLIAELLPV